MAKEKIAKKPMSKRRKKELIFIIALLAYPDAQFLLTWIFVNSYSIILAFENVSMEGDVSFAGFDNFIYVIQRIYRKDLGAADINGGGSIPQNLLIIVNSLGYGVVSIFISLPLALIASYFLSKKMPFANIFRVIFFLPNIISIVALIYAFRMQLDSTSGLIYHFLDSLGIKIKDSVWPNTSIIVYVYCIWAGIGYNVLLLSGAIGRVPKELFESSQMDGAGNFKQFTKIMIPMVWPTIVTMIIMVALSRFLLSKFVNTEFFNNHLNFFIGYKENKKERFTKVNFIKKRFVYYGLSLLILVVIVKIK